MALIAETLPVDFETVSWFEKLAFAQRLPHSKLD
jgi:hypothetical protein